MGGRGQEPAPPFRLLSRTAGGKAGDLELSLVTGAAEETRRDPAQPPLPGPLLAPGFPGPGLDTRRWDLQGWRSLRLRSRCPAAPVARSPDPWSGQTGPLHTSSSHRPGPRLGSLPVGAGQAEAQWEPEGCSASPADRAPFTAPRAGTGTCGRKSHPARGRAGRPGSQGRP